MMLKSTRLLKTQIRMFNTPAMEPIFESKAIVRPRKGKSQYMAEGGMPFDMNGVLALP